MSSAGSYNGLLIYCFVYYFSLFLEEFREGRLASQLVPSED